MKFTPRSEPSRSSLLFSRQLICIQQKEQNLQLASGKPQQRDGERRGLVGLQAGFGRLHEASSGMIPAGRGQSRTRSAWGFGAGMPSKSSWSDAALLTRRAVHPAWGLGAGIPTKSFGSNGSLLGWRRNLPSLKLWGRNTFKRAGIGLGWPPRRLQEPRVLLVELVTGVSGCLLSPKGKALCSCRAVAPIYGWLEREELLVMASWPFF